MEAGANFVQQPDEQVVGIERNGRVLGEEDQKIGRLIADIEKELALEGYGPGDWVKVFAQPVALLLGKQDCVACEVRRVILNAAKKLCEKYGEIVGKAKVKDLFIRSFKEKPEAILLELKALLESVER